MMRNSGSSHPLARRAAIATLTVLTGSGIGLVAAPAFGQGASVTNAGSASANSGGNTAVGNASTNTASATVPSGGLINVPITLGGPTNTSDGTANVTTGAATAVGNSSDTGIRQSNASGNTVNSFLAGQNQGAGVLNAGSGSANSGGNNAIGNGSQNTATITPDATGGLLGVSVGLGAPENRSTGAANVTTGAANAVGNNAATGIAQEAGRGGGPVAIDGRGADGRGFDGRGVDGRGVDGRGAVAGVGGAGLGQAPCSGSRFGSFQNVEVNNRGQAEANTGNNTAIGNASTNDASATVPGQTVSGGLLGVGVQIGGPVNNSSGTAVINTGPATATGNNSTTGVTQQEGCPQVATLGGGGRQPIIVPATRNIVLQGQQVVRPTNATLARTGLDTGDLGMIAGATLGLGILLVASQRRRFTARFATVPMAGLGFGLGAGDAGNDWDGAIR